MYLNILDCCSACVSRFLEETHHGLLLRSDCRDSEKGAAGMLLYIGNIMGRLLGKSINYLK